MTTLPRCVASARQRFASTLAFALCIAGFASQAEADEPRSGAPNAEAAGGGALFIQVRYATGAGAARDAFHLGRVDAGGRIRSRNGYLGFDLGVGIGGGAFREVATRSLAQHVEMALLLDMRVYLNPRSRAQLFVVSGAQIGLVGLLQHSSEEEDCEGSPFVEGSLGFGVQIRLRKGSISALVRGVRRRHFGGELPFVQAGRNPPGQVAQGAFGVSAAIQLSAPFESIGSGDTWSGCVR